jgi:site-specific recombinase XerC
MIRGYKSVSRKQQLLKVVIQCLERDNQGSLETRKHRYQTMRCIIDDFYASRMVLDNWHAVTSAHIKNLLVFWKKQGLKSATIMNKLVDFRYFLHRIGHHIPNIDNQSLSLKKHRVDTKPRVQADALLKDINEPIAYSILALQVKFGLTPLEAMSFVPSIHIQDDALWITREISTNHKDRIVPIVTEEQQAIIKKLTVMTEGKSLKQQFGEQHVRLAYKFALSTEKLPTNINYRYLYAKARFADLCNDYIRMEAKTMVMQEMCISRTSPVWKTISEQY